MSMERFLQERVNDTPIVVELEAGDDVSSQQLLILTCSKTRCKNR